MTNKNQRIAKFIASSGYCSRRDAEKLILEGKVKLNCQPVLHPATLVSGQESITVDGKKLGAIPKARIWLYNKPRGLITSHKDTKGRKTVFESLPEYLPRVISVGRLDYNTEGLLLLTNSGSLARKLELPANQLTRRYRCRIFGSINDTQMKALSDGITIDGISYKSIAVSIPERKHTYTDSKSKLMWPKKKAKNSINHLAKNSTSNSWIEISLAEGKNREIRKIFEHFGMEVSRLIRTHYGPFNLGDLQTGAVREANAEEMRKIMEI